ncbi:MULTISPECIES: SDR family oxidoreductase [Shewanella]|jgi:NAD(P)-dependent dehydrogenase (short-subunit alcohol dehydrogenase family)|uniref:SDR family oxidoreductase n=1 Tax=Shewanella xiamenensis TaxID=332186 RepID=A0AAW6QSU6_9GAMM|nr:MULTISPECIES: SDR family oxidoreductase [Shewanella]KEK29095.1 short chain dehydrogenase [Shewanella xiamenensis]MDG5898425.1 SDR family oxidoreductase [Shewanella xiamenensis]MDI5835479.1 SDR family oxidoreductase [Shewanella xiamenensis]MDI5840573.1 SDR family oxidoreductase [Shewanella xiamenensis]MDI5844552.1 SDR family oxidoreductase [Shewanella xiamenensis]
MSSHISNQISNQSNSDKAVIVIIGGTSGIGAALARQLTIDNQIVHVASRQTGVDVADEQSVNRFFESIGAFDHLVITAGSSAPAGKVVDVDFQQAKAAFDTKFWGSINATKQAVRYIKQGGSITLTTGMLSRKVVANTYVKSTMNAALEAFTKVLAKELAPIRVNAVSPGLTRTGSMPAQTAMYEQAKATLPVAKVGEPRDIAMAYYLAMNNSFMTGAIIDVDGGALIS